MIKLLDDLDISIDEYLLLFLIYKQRDDLAGMYYRSSRKNNFSRERVNRLISKKLLATRGDNSKPYSFNRLYVTERFTKHFDTSDLAREYYELYPDFIMVRDSPYPARNVSYEAFKVTYDTIVAGDLETHNRMLEVLRYAVSKDMVNVGLRKWLDYKHYQTIDKLMQQDSATQNSSYATETV